MEDKRGKNQIQTIIGKATTFLGTISSAENIQIDGKQEGEITTKGGVVISETGNVQGKIQAESLLLAGSFEGETIVNGKLEILATGKLRGQAEMAILIVEEGAQFEGESRQNKK
ncbi:MAG TPA: polymer-forming cytoskeletal protein [Firmicutes bacterium]|jgi:cytoskeletal protein CcmA (bactofilin family)|nr:polymer-forming cytoskeletal protein [Bacillota bacterium]